MPGYKVPVLTAQQESWKDRDTEILFYHRKNREFVDRDKTNVRSDVVFFQDAVHITSGGILCDDKGSSVQLFYRKRIVSGQGMTGGQNSQQLVIQSREKMVMVTGLITEKADVNAAFLDPVGQLSFQAFCNFEQYIGMAALESLYDPWDPVDRAAQDKSRS